MSARTAFWPVLLTENLACSGKIINLRCISSIRSSGALDALAGSCWEWSIDGVSLLACYFSGSLHTLARHLSVTHKNLSQNVVYACHREAIELWAQSAAHLVSRASLSGVHTHTNIGSALTRFALIWPRERRLFASLLLPSAFFRCTRATSDCTFLASSLRTPCINN